MTTHGAERPGGPVGTSFHLSRGRMEYLKLIEMTGGLVAKFLGLNKDRKLEVAGYLSDIAEALSAVRGWKVGRCNIRRGSTPSTLALLPRMYWIKGRFSAFLSLPAQVHDAKDPLLYVRTVVEDTIPKVDPHDRALPCCFRNRLSCTYTNMIMSRGIDLMPGISNDEFMAEKIARTTVVREFRPVQINKGESGELQRDSRPPMRLPSRTSYCHKA